MVAGLAAELEDQNVINEGYLSSAECNVLVVSAPRPPPESDRLVRPPAGADDHMVMRFFFLLKLPQGGKLISLVHPLESICAFVIMCVVLVGCRDVQFIDTCAGI